MIGVVLPSSPLPEEKIAALESTNYVLPRNLRAKTGYLAGSDEERAEAFMEVWLNPHVDIVWGARGGYGAMRILPLLDFDLLLKHPKPFIGMSDITALHIAFNNLGLPTFLGANICSLLGTRSDEMGYKLFPIVPGKLRGPVVGGNLSLIAALLGTPWQLDTAGKLLVLEDVNEPPYKVDRMLTHMKLAGLFDEVTGVVLGDLEAEEFFKGSPFPVYEGLPSGHIEDQVLVPLLLEIDLELAEDHILVNPSGGFL